MILVLDFDGTLVDCRRRQCAVMAWVLGDEALDPDAFWAAKREGASTLQALEQLGHADAADRAARWVEAVEDPEWLAFDAPLPGVDTVLAAVRDRGVEPVVLSARRHAHRLRRQAEALGLARVHVVDPARAVRAKATVLRELAPVGFVGDTVSDGRAAASAGVPFAAVDTGQRSARFLAAHGMAPVYPRLGDAVRALLP